MGESLPLALPSGAAVFQKQTVTLMTFALGKHSALHHPLSF